jgi:hypothetical protein
VRPYGTLRLGSGQALEAVPFPKPVAGCAAHSAALGAPSPRLAKEARHGAPGKLWGDPAGYWVPNRQQVPPLRRRWRSGCGRDDTDFAGLRNPMSRKGGETWGTRHPARASRSSSKGGWVFFRPAGAFSRSTLHPRLTPWAAFFRRFAAKINVTGGGQECPPHTAPGSSGQPRAAVPTGALRLRSG